MGRHLIQLVEVAVGIHIAEAGTRRLVDEEQVGEFIPRAGVVFQGMVVLESIWSDFHQRTIHRATSRSAIQPDHGPLSVGDVAVLKMPKEQVGISFGLNLDVPGKGCQD